MTLAEARLHLRYSAWASIQLVEVVRSVPDAILKTVGISHGSLLGTLAHILWADWLWFNRIAGRARNRWRDQLKRERHWRQSGPVFKTNGPYGQSTRTRPNQPRRGIHIDFDGKLTRVPAWQIILHVVNHATLHRGQVIGMLRQMGIAPPHTDLMNYYRILPA
jgi:uncharacterized damage-inducible protein DinB